MLCEHKPIQETLKIGENNHPLSHLTNHTKGLKLLGFALGDVQHTYTRVSILVKETTNKKNSLIWVDWQVDRQCSGGIRLVL